MGWLEINVHLFAVGLAYFMPLDLAFSCWFFYWLWRLEALIGSAFFGVPGSGGVAFSFFSTGRFPYSQEQSIGTCAAILLMAAWGLRPVGRGILDSFSRSFREATSGGCFQANQTECTLSRQRMSKRAAYLGRSRCALETSWRLDSIRSTPPGKTRPKRCVGVLISATARQGMTWIGYSNDTPALSPEAGATRTRSSRGKRGGSTVKAPRT